MSLRASIGTLAVLGLRDIRMAAVPTTAYLMVGGQCAGNCAYCGQGRGAGGDHSHLSRIVWPEVSERWIMEALASHRGAFQRVCVQTTASRGTLQQLAGLVPRIVVAGDGVPISVAYRVQRHEEAERLFAIGVDRIGVAIDCCSQELYSKLRGGSLTESVRMVEDLAQRYPGRISTHLIIGLGEDEMEAARLLIELHQAGVLVSLFAFTPVKGTQMEDGTPPVLSSYRKLQLLLGLLDQNNEQFHVAYDERRNIHGFGMTEGRLRAFLRRHFVFTTHGCPGCNRPYYNETPGGTMFNYPTMQPEAVEREIDSFIGKLKEDGFDFTARTCKLTTLDAPTTDPVGE